MGSYSSNRVATLNIPDSTVKTKMTDISFQVFSLLWDVQLGKIKLPDDMNPEYIEVSMTPKIGKDKVKISAPIEYWQFAIKLQSLVRQANELLRKQYGDDHRKVMKINRK